MLHLAKNVSLATDVVVHQIAGDMCALRHPVEPDAGGIAATIDVIVTDRHVNCAVELDARHFGAREQLKNMAIMNLISRHGAE